MSKPSVARPLAESSDAARFKQVQTLARILDDAVAIPGTNVRLGLDAIIGLFPIGGDLLGVVLSSFIVLQSKRLGVPKSVQNKMWANIAIDAVAGFVPVIGDVIDVGWKANRKNAQLLEDHLRGRSH